MEEVIEVEVEKVQEMKKGERDGRGGGGGGGGGGERGVLETYSTGNRTVFSSRMRCNQQRRNRVGRLNYFK